MSNETATGRTLRLPGIGFGPQVQLAVSGTVMLFVTLALWRQVSLTATVPPWPLLLAAAASLVLSYRHVPALAWLWWALGTLSLLWSAAPGNTLVWALWGIFYLAAMALGSWRFGFAVVNLVLLYSNLEKALALNYFGLESYLSGSVHYVTGAQALVLIPLAFVAALRTRRWWLALGAFVVLVMASYAALISGARAVYVPLVVVAVALPLRSLVSGIRWYRVLSLVLLLGFGLWGLDAVIPKGPAPVAETAVATESATSGSPLANALSTKASIEAQAAGVATYGGVRNRLRLWHQGVAAGIANPLGTGAGSFASIIHSYQLYPMAWSNSAHNILIEAFAELGWLGILTMGLLVLLPFVLVWLGPNWPIALSVFGIWFTLLVDVTASHAYLMTIAFATLGACYAALQQPKPDHMSWLARLRGPAPPIAVVAAMLIATGLSLWWYLPCRAANCTTARYLGYASYTVSAVRASPRDVQQSQLARLRELNPLSSWVVQLALALAETPAERLVYAREIAERFPYQHPQNYLQWARLALANGNPVEARHALERGFAIFPPDRLPFSEFRLTPEQYRTNWIDPATELLADLQ